MAKTKKPSDKKKDTPLTQVKKGVEQLTDAKLKERTRFYIPSAIIRLAELCNSKNDAVSLGAIKVLLAKNLPDLKATELSTDAHSKLLFAIIQDNTLRDANKEDKPTDKAVPKAS